MYAINLIPILPLRANAAEESELITQILYGEIVTVLELIERWARVENFADGETGWVDRKMLTFIDKEQFDEYAQTMTLRTYYPITECRDFTNYDNGEKLLLPGGSVVHNNNWEFKTINNSPVFNTSDIFYQMFTPQNSDGDFIVQKAKEYLNAPYLWGGKCIFGIDCSGLVQVVYAIAGVQLPRMSRRQAECGSEVHFLEDARAGDLAFFGKEGSAISHVGILLNSSQILHASGWVKIERIDNHGIISSVTGKHTHVLRTIKRII
ncbi:MAG: C40 family peptidase [Paludibacter sp.]|jgi:hypothetical protein|nr:C40 family peptidase [Paludibacter sp.]